MKLAIFTLAFVDLQPRGEGKEATSVDGTNMIFYKKNTLILLENKTFCLLVKEKNKLRSMIAHYLIFG
ncbi:unnamed protein product [Blepharisma stoltei]|uniref:Uncharacterized protein n=1 Tax=Blepharisma stoltei TaxID=1481888 RepID=A0AAU9JD47_9CILI|nr:unnamed protein product [Blepharisma stoltei]